MRKSGLDVPVERERQTGQEHKQLPEEDVGRSERNGPLFKATYERNKANGQM